MRRLVATLTIAVLTVGAAACGDGAATTTDDCGPAATAELQPAPDAPLGDQAAGGEPLPDLVVATLDDCTPVATSSWLGDRPLVVNFWASWCGPCKDEMPVLEAVAEELSGQVRVIGVTFQDRPADSRAFLEQVGVGYDNFVDADGQDLFRASGARGTPSTLLVTADGRIVHRHAGVVTREQLLASIERHLGVDGA